MRFRNFEQEIRQAGPKAEQIAAMLSKLGIDFEPIDWQRSGLLALVVSNGIQIGDLISLEADPDRLLEQIRSAYVTKVAADALNLRHGGHVIRITPIVHLINSNWSAEVSFEHEERYALICEFIEPAENEAGYRRVYKLYSAKGDSFCDVPGCMAFYYERKVAEMTDGPHCVHVCKRHQNEDAERLFLRLWRMQQRASEQEERL